jgi:hypothetical protein
MAVTWPTRTRSIDWSAEAASKPTPGGGGAGAFAAGRGLPALALRRAESPLLRGKAIFWRRVPADTLANTYG